MINVSNYTICRASVAFVWVYHGLVPKLLGPHVDEIAMNRAIGFSESAAIQLSMAAGVGELLFGVFIIAFWRARWPLLLTALAMVVLLLFSLLTYSQLAMAAFNPVTTNLAVFVLSIVAYRLHDASNSKG